MIAIGYPGQPGKQTAFTYDGLSRRATIASTPAGGGGTVTTSYLWCGSVLCQARNASNAPVRRYLAEGEYVPGTPGQAYYYGVDQIGTVRRVFSAGGSPAYAYDPYGNPLQGTAPLTDMGYAGMFQNPDSGSYDPAAGRWLARDPLGERNAEGTNLYAYVSGNPISYIDPLGLCKSRTGKPRPDYCSTSLYMTGKMLSDVGEATYLLSPARYLQGAPTGFSSSHLRASSFPPSAALFIHSLAWAGSTVTPQPQA